MNKKFINIKEMLNHSCKEFSSKVAIMDKNNQREYFSKTYKELQDDINALGTELIDLGLEDKKIVIIGRNCYEWSLSYLSIISGVGIVSPIDKQLSVLEIISNIQRINASAVIYSDDMIDIITEIRDNFVNINFISMQKSEIDLDIDTLVNKGYDLLKNNDSRYTSKIIDENQLAALFFTSGTTTESKIVMLSHKNIMANVNGAKEYIKYGSNDITFSVLPLHHTLECTCGFISPLSGGTTIAYNDSIKNMLKNMVEIKPSVMFVVPRFLESIKNMIEKETIKKGKEDDFNRALKITSFIKINKLKRILFKEIHQKFGNNLKMIIVGGAPIDKEVVTFFEKIGILVLQGYGLTECAPLIAVNSTKKHKADSAGLFISDTQFKLVNIDENKIGELKVKGNQVMLGYYNDLDSTKKVIDNDGFLSTGDLVSIDKKGFIRIKGRSKNLIITSNGENISPEELEEKINKHDLVKESVVYIKKSNNGREILVSEVVINEEIAKKIKDNPLYKEEIVNMISNYIKQINSTLPDYKKINNVNVREEEFEKTTTLKIKRYKIN